MRFMCNRYNIQHEIHEVTNFYQLALPIAFDLPADDILPGHLAPGLILNRDGERELVPMQFGLAKIGATEPFDRKFPNNNARVEKYDKWPWKLPFQEHRCILPLSEFREPCYWGNTAGCEVYFKPADGSLLSVAGICNVWKTEGTERFYSMAFLMRPACQYVMDHGHHRQPFFLDSRRINEWMKPSKRDPIESLAILREFVHEPPLDYRVERQMATSWKTRQKDRLADRDEQLAELDKTGLPLGI
jgi:putative SOS response-associated peptidase YedK